MSQKISLPDNILDELKCTFCNEYLSCFPIHMYAEDGVVACGRCPLLQDDNPIREVAYEKVAKAIIFPCKYKSLGCLEEFTPDNLNSHEESCNFRQYFCPLIPLGTCSWQGPMDELLQHYMNQHSSLVLNELEFKMMLVNRESVNYILKFDNYIFIVHVNCNLTDNKVYISLRFLGKKASAEQYAYQISLYRLDMQQDRVYGKDVVQCDNDMKLNKNEAIIVNVDEVKNIFFDPFFVVCKISIINKTAQIEIEKKTETVDDQFNETIIKTLECPVCFNPMVPPIYQCVAGHSICDSCKSQVNDCPTCHARIQNTRNYLLEEMTGHFKYPCKYREYDCTFISTANETKLHEVDCTFGPYKCPFKDFDECDWKGKLELLLSHIRVKHEDVILDMDTLTVYVDDDNLEEIFIINRFKQIFKLLLKCDENYWYLSIQLIGPKTEATNYFYEIDFVDKEINERNYFKRRCSCNAPFNDAFGTDCLKLPIYMIQPYIKNEILSFKYRIFEI